MHQLRLRNLSGIILVDFIDFAEQEHLDALVDTLETLAAKDTLATKFVDITGLKSRGAGKASPRKEHTRTILFAKFLTGYNGSCNIYGYAAQQGLSSVKGRHHRWRVMIEGGTSMYAIIATGGKQYKVSEGDIIKVEKLGVEAGQTVTFDQVLAVNTAS